MMRIAIIGGGPGGLLTAYELENRCASMFEATLFEASHRIGGKISGPRATPCSASSHLPVATSAASTLGGRTQLIHLVRRNCRPLSYANTELPEPTVNLHWAAG
jgi:2-polyprenyl-6-methoxyphenol hydroxylase-like FAD-dependent oxidoreductase